jgi:hypothetical protein
MSRPFKAALCLAFMPDAYGFSFGAWVRSCHRRKDHDGSHRVAFRDGGVREWKDGDRESALRRPKSRKGGRKG